MRTVEVLQIVSAVAGALASVAGAVETRLVKRLRTSGATSEEDAIHLGRIHPLSRWRLQRLLRSGAVCTADSGAVYLDEQTFRARRKRRRTIALTVAAVLTAAILLAVSLW